MIVALSYRLSLIHISVMDEDDYLAKLEESIDEKRALVLREGDILIGAMAFTYSCLLYTSRG